jgi:hypothetical protein
MNALEKRALASKMTSEEKECTSTKIVLRSECTEGSVWFKKGHAKTERKVM